MLKWRVRPRSLVRRSPTSICIERSLKNRTFKEAIFLVLISGPRGSTKRSSMRRIFPEHACQLAMPPAHVSCEQTSPARSSEAEVSRGLILRVPIFVARTSDVLVSRGQSYMARTCEQSIFMKRISRARPQTIRPSGLTDSIQFFTVCTLPATCHESIGCRPHREVLERFFRGSDFPPFPRHDPIYTQSIPSGSR